MWLCPEGGGLCRRRGRSRINTPASAYTRETPDEEYSVADTDAAAAVTSASASAKRKQGNLALLPRPGDLHAVPATASSFISSGVTSLLEPEESDAIGGRATSMITAPSSVIFSKLSNFLTLGTD